MNRSLRLVLFASLATACSAGNTTDVSLEALGLPGASVSDGDSTVLVDGAGAARLTSRRLAVRTSLFGTEIIGEYTPERFDDAPCGAWQR